MDDNNATEVKVERFYSGNLITAACRLAMFMNDRHIKRENVLSVVASDDLTTYELIYIGKKENGDEERWSL